MVPNCLGGSHVDDDDEKGISQFDIHIHTRASCEGKFGFLSQCSENW